MPTNLFDRLRAPFRPEQVSWRIGSTNADKTRGMALCYIDARDVQDRLDEVCGPENWQCRYLPCNGPKTVCEIGIRWGARFMPSANAAALGAMEHPGEWVWKSDGAGDSDVEAEKGALSDAFKRAAVRWGIGRYLYDLESPWVEIEQKGRSYVIKQAEYKRLAQVAGKAGGAPSRDPEPANERGQPVPDSRAIYVENSKRHARTFHDPQKLTEWFAKERKLVWPDFGLTEDDPDGKAIIEECRFQKKVLVERSAA